MTSPNFNKVLLDISNELSDQNLDNLKFLVGDKIGKRDRERITSGRELFRILTERNLLAADNTDYLSALLRDISRDDLADRLQPPGVTPEPEDLLDPSNPETARLSASFQVVSQNLGRSWRKLGRRLGVSEVKLETIAQKHPSDLEETAMELLKEWTRSSRDPVQTSTLIRALRGCDFNLTADKVEDKLTALHL